MTTTSIESLVRDYVPGVKISVPGIYRNVPMDAYHADICDGPSLSSTPLRTYEKKRSMKHVWDEFYLNPDRKPEEEVAHYNIGRALHHLSAGEVDFRKHFSVRPVEFDSWRTKEAKAWRAKENLAGRAVLIPSDIDDLLGMAKSLKEHPTIEAGILRGLVEHSIFWKDPVTGLWLKSRPDVIPVDTAQMIADLKTTTDASAQAVIRANGEWAYPMQGAMALDGLRAVTGHHFEQFVLVYIEKSRPYGINHKPINAFSMQRARQQLRRAIDAMDYAIKNNFWPGFDDDEVEGGYPKYYLDRLEWEEAHGILPKLTNTTAEPDEVV